MNASFRWPLFLACACGLIGFGLVATLSGIGPVWQDCYLFSLAAALAYLLGNRQNIFSVSALLVLISFIAHTAPAIPYLYFGMQPVDSFDTSLFINSYGLLVLVCVCTLRAPQGPIRIANVTPEIRELWSGFVASAWKIFFLTLPFVFLTMYVSGGWKVYTGDLEPGDFSRTANFKGLGPLMIFTSLNVYSATAWTLSLLARRRWLAAAAVMVATVGLNGFSLGRGNLIFMAVVGALCWSLCFRITLRMLMLAALAGTGIVLLQLTRGSGNEGPASALELFLAFSADFDSLNNTAHLVNYVKANGFPGWYHMATFFLDPVPRTLFPGKPHFIGILYLNDLVFPGLYRGAEGGSNFTFGIYGTWYAVAGMPTMIGGIAATALVTTWADALLARWARAPAPTTGLMFYLLLVGQIVILYRDGVMVFVNMPIYPVAYILAASALGTRIHKSFWTSFPSRTAQPPGPATLTPR